MKSLSKIIFSLSLAYSLLSLIFYLSPYEFLWRYSFMNIFYMKMLPPFADLRWISATSECGVDVLDIATRLSPGCDPYGRNDGGLPYPPFSIEFARFLHLSISNTQVCGFLFGLTLIIFFVFLAFSVFKFSPLFYFSSSILLFSFPLQLGIERGNLDVIVFILVISSSVLISLRSNLLSVFSAPFMFLAVATKAYPFFGFFPFAFFCIPDIGRFRRLLLIFSSILGLFLVIPWYLQSSSDIPKAGWRVISHGFFISQFFYSPFLFFQQLISFIFLLLGLFLGIKFCSRQIFLESYLGTLCSIRSRFLYILTSLSGLIWLACYFISVGYDYRLIFLFPALLYLFFFADLFPINFAFGNLIRISIYLSIISVCLSYYSWIEPLRFISTGLLNLFSLVNDSICLPFLASLTLSFILPSRSTYLLARLLGRPVLPAS